MFNYRFYGCIFNYELNEFYELGERIWGRRLPGWDECLEGLGAETKNGFSCRGAKKAVVSCA